MTEIILNDGNKLNINGFSAVYTDRQTSRTIALDTAMAMAIGQGVIDANGAVFFQRQLEHIKARSYDRTYAELKARMLFPVSNDGGQGITTITYHTYDRVGAAKIISAYANDLPRADISGKETTTPVKSVGISYGYNIDEIQASQLTGASLDQRRANAARRAVEESINKIAFFGDPEFNLPGLFNNNNITSSAVAAGSGAGATTKWETKTADEILFDITTIFSDIFNVTKMAERANTLLVPPKQWTHIVSTPRASNSDTTIAQYIASNSPYLKSVDDIVPVNECAADTNHTISSDVIVAYDRSPDKLQLEIPVEFEMLPVQQKNLEFVIPGRARVGGLNIYYPLSINIASGV